MLISFLSCGLIYAKDGLVARAVSSIESENGRNNGSDDQVKPNEISKFKIFSGFSIIIIKALCNGAYIV